MLLAAYNFKKRRVESNLFLLPSTVECEAQDKYIDITTDLDLVTPRWLIVMDRYSS